MVDFKSGMSAVEQSIVTATVKSNGVYVPVDERPEWLKVGETYMIRAVHIPSLSAVERTFTGHGEFALRTWVNNSRVGEQDEIDIRIFRVKDEIEIV